MSENKKAVLLLAFGGPDSLDSVEPFLKSVLGRRPVFGGQLKKVKEKYKFIGGKSPITEITFRQAKALENELAKKHKDLKVYIGMRHWHPFIKDTLVEMVKDGVKKAIAVRMAPHNSKASTGGYAVSLNKATGELPVSPVIDFVGSWHMNPLFLQALAGKIKEGLSKFDKGRCNNVHIIFSAHSLVKKLIEDDPYVAQLNETISGVLNLIGPLNYSLAYQSGRSGLEEWLGPDVGLVLEGIAQKGEKDVLIVPFGFVSDHIETLYDIDVVYKNQASSLGLNFVRTNSFNDSPQFIEALASIVLKKLEAAGGR